MSFDELLKYIADVYHINIVDSDADALFNAMVELAWLKDIGITNENFADKQTKYINAIAEIEIYSQHSISHINFPEKQPADVHIEIRQLLDKYSDDAVTKALLGFVSGIENIKMPRTTKPYLKRKKSREEVKKMFDNILIKTLGI